MYYYMLLVLLEIKRLIFGNLGYEHTLTLY